VADTAALKPEPEPEPVLPPQPSAYAIPPSIEEMPVETKSGQRAFPSSIPRAGASSSPIPSIPQQPIRNLNAEDDGVVEETPAQEKVVEQKPAKIERRERREPSDNAKRAAKSLAKTIEFTRNLSAGIGERIKNFLPRLLPRDELSESEMPANTLMLIMALVVPLVVVTIASVVYLRYGRSLQYDTYLNQAQSLRAQAAGLSTPVEQRKAWESVLLNVELAESHRITPETSELRIEAEQNLDELLGITRVQFNEAFVSRIGINISRMAASETDLFMLNADNGEVLRAQLTSGRGFQLDTSFSCKPGAYDLYTVGPLVDILAMPNLNSINATLLGIDANGNLLYCEPGQVGRAIPLAPPDTNWGRVTAFTLDGNNLYVLDAISRAVWVYPGKDGAFVDRPYFFFGGQTPEKQDVIDLVVLGDDLYMLHADGHLSTCSYSRVESNPTRCQDPTPLVNKFGAYQDMDLFGSAHFTQMLLNAPPNQSVLILDADTQGVMSFASRSLEMERQLRPTTGNANPLPSGPVEAITVGPNHVLYLALNGQVYFSTEMP
jgi:uncharacterized membrane protein